MASILPPFHFSLPVWVKGPLQIPLSPGLFRFSCLWNLEPPCFIGNEGVLAEKGKKGKGRSQGKRGRASKGGGVKGAESAKEGRVQRLWSHMCFEALDWERGPCMITFFLEELVFCFICGPDWPITHSHALASASGAMG